MFAGDSHEEKTMAAIMLGYHAAARRLLGRPIRPEPEIKPDAFLDIPDAGFTGPF